jgi:glycosyltransferase involved in cell wall biosynthesis
MIVLAAVYQPGDRLPAFIRDLQAAAPAETTIVTVDDGSDAAHDHVLQQARDAGATVLRHGANRGKGAALKTGLRHIAGAHPGQDVVCADPDGQHSVADVLRVAERVRDTGDIVLGVREFGADVPARSRLGNLLTRRLFHAATGRAVRDTQTGLRGYPARLVPWLLTVVGERYEYEMNVLLRAADDALPIDEIPIATTYLNDDSTSHFGSLSDSARIYLPLARRAASPRGR